MTERKLTAEQIDDLFAFCEEQDVRYYDLQMELVDHMANAIEQMWKKHPSLSYKKAVWQVFDDFGQSGFREICREKQKMLRRKYEKLRWKYIGEFYKLPKIILTIVATGILFLIFKTFGLTSPTTFIFLKVLLIPSFIVLGVSTRKKLRIRLSTNKKFMLLAKLDELKIGMFSLFATPCYLFLFPKAFADTMNGEYFGSVTLSIVEMGAAFTIVFFFIAFYVGYIYLPQRIKEDFTREFPQFVKS